MTTARDALGREVAALIDRLGGGASDDGARDALIDRVARYQRERVEPYGRLCAQRDLARAASVTGELRAPTTGIDLSHAAADTDADTADAAPPDIASRVGKLPVPVMVPPVTLV